ncbi:hypothetical protein AJ78_01647 [Emergomyces pasteurianus Ep9510]|uniref:Uncharacterized protein n=1 Tax=Emergomyces pasteurianus Ep9510 TaxID=1447872 RepID=A0A1J9PQ73_9EURO|nr:hypothetical protein AJ78_01647 [Emergomyces pasteurianus Ep9510]
MAEGRLILDQTKMNIGLEALDKALGEDPMIYAFSPITMVSPGGYLAVSYFQNRSTTEDIDVIIDPDGGDLGFGQDWINDTVTLFLTQPARKSLFNDAEQQNIVLWSGENLRVLGAPLEWGLETKLRRLSTKPLHRKIITDTDDVQVLLNALINRNKGPLERNTVQRLNRNGFDVGIGDRVLDRVAEGYQERYGNSPFSEGLTLVR